MTDLPSPPPAEPGPARPPAPRRLPLALAVLAALLAGGSLLVALPPFDLWWLAPVGVAALALATYRRSWAGGAGLGAIAGLALFVPLLSWTNLEIGYGPWLLLAGLQAAFLAALGAASAVLSPLVARWPWSAAPLVALVWVGQEAARSRLPFGGFPWGRLAFSQADSPLLPLATLGGAPLLGAVVALIGGLLASAVAILGGLLGPGRVSWRRPAALLGAAVVLGLAGLAVPLREPAGPTVTVAIVQGNVPRLGFDFNAQRRAVLDNHVQATIELADRVAGGEVDAPDLVVWPENSSDIDPIANPDAAALISQAADAVGAPILVGAIVRDPAVGPYNVGLVWEPGTGPGQMYAKQAPVPFAEYLPMASVLDPLARLVAGDNVDRISGFVAGDQPGVLAMGPATVGDVICFEVAYDGLVRDTVTGGAQLLAVQTNNATFNEAEAAQQLAMVRVRAVEHGRESLMASTVGISGFVGVDGRVSDATGFFTREVPVRTLTLTDERTVATMLGAWPERLMVAGALAGLVGAVIMRRRPTAAASGKTTHAKRGPDDSRPARDSDRSGAGAGGDPHLQRGGKSPPDHRPGTRGGAGGGDPGRR